MPESIFLQSTTLKSNLKYKTLGKMLNIKYFSWQCIIDTLCIIDSHICLVLGEGPGVLVIMGS